MNKSKSGFTIVELLIVIVVIAILAAISIVAYTGIQSRAYTSRLQADINQITKVVQIHEANEGAVPICSAGSGMSCALDTLTLPSTPSLPVAQRSTYTYVGVTSNGNWAVRTNADNSSSTLCKFGHYPTYPTWFSSAPAC